jgi:hypothetical protein
MTQHYKKGILINASMKIAIIRKLSLFIILHKTGSISFMFAPVAKLLGE